MHQNIIRQVQAYQLSLPQFQNEIAFLMYVVYFHSMYNPYYQE